MEPSLAGPGRSWNRDPETNGARPGSGLIGAISSQVQLRKNLDAVARAEAQGAKRLVGGEQIHVESGGNFMAPAILTEVTPLMEVWREEVFGPVLAVTRFDSEEEATALANATPYGLASAVWTGSLSTAHRMVRAIRAGVVHVNAYGGADITVPLGGFKQSGFGRDKSLQALEEGRRGPRIEVEARRLDAYDRYSDRC